MSPLRAGAWLAIALAAAAAGAPAVTSAADGASLSVSPAAVSVAKGQVFAVQILQTSPVATSGAQASLDFDPQILQVVSVDRGSGYAAAPLLVPKDIATDIRTANASGHLAQVAAVFTPPDSVAAGTSSFLLVRFRVVGCGETDLDLPTGGPYNAQMISGERNGYGDPVPVSGTSRAHVTTCVGSDAVTGSDLAPVAAVTADPGPSPMAAGAGLAIGAAAAVIAGAGWLALRSRRRRDLDEFVE